jgi:hypothetical protein
MSTSLSLQYVLQGSVTHWKEWVLAQKGQYSDEASMKWGSSAVLLEGKTSM